MDPSSGPGPSALSRHLHWLVAGLVVVIYASMELRGWFPRGGLIRSQLHPLHQWLGLSILLLLALRLWARWRQPFGPSEPPPPAWLHRLAQLGHLALYAFLLVMPVLGWALVSAEGKPPSLLGFSLPALLNADEQLAHQLEDWHELGAILGYYLIGGHLLAALWHHFGRRDNTLRRMRW